MSPDYLLDKHFFHQFINNFTPLLCKMNVIDIFNVVDFFKIFVISESTEILIESNLWSGVYA